MWLCAAVIVGPTLTAACTSSTTISADLAISSVTIVDVETGELRADQTVLISGDRIVMVVPTALAAPPAGAQLVDGEGRYLIPGLWDAHVHAARNLAWHLPMFLAHGVTAIRNMNPGTDDAIPLTQSIRRRLASGDLLGPRMIAGGPTVDGDPPAATSPMVARDAAAARAAVDALADAEMDFVKVYENLSRDAYFALMARAEELGAPVDGHIPFRVLPEEAAAAGQRTIEHLRGMEWGCASNANVHRVELERLVDSLAAMTPDEQVLAVTRHQRALFDARDEALCQATAEAYRRNGVAVVPTMIVYPRIARPEAVLAGPDAQLVPAPLVARWRAMTSSRLWSVVQSEVAPIPDLQLANVRLLHEVGVVILAGTDVGGGGPEMLIPGLSLHEELELLIDAGLSPIEALRAATIDPARVFGLDGELGRIAEGTYADLVLLDANPLEDITNTRRIEAVVVNGRYLDRSALVSLRARASVTP